MEFAIHIICQECRATLEPIHANVTESILAIGVRALIRMQAHRAECRVLHPERPSGLAAIIGKWPGDETEKEVQRVLKKLS